MPTFPASQIAGREFLLFYSLSSFLAELCGDQESGSIGSVLYFSVSIQIFAP
jgi:hypothetical protein